MSTVKVLVQTAWVSFMVIWGAGFVAYVAYEAGISDPMIMVASGAAFGVLGYTMSRAWDSEISWAWALMGMIFGVFSFPAFYFCAENYRTNLSIPAPGHGDEQWTIPVPPGAAAPTFPLSAEPNGSRPGTPVGAS